MTILACAECIEPLPRLDARCPACNSTQATRVQAYRAKHARAAESARRWHWAWRRIHALSNCRDDEGPAWTRSEYTIDVGYCLDRYTIDNPEQEPQ